MLYQCWATVYDAGPTLVQHWVDVSCLQGNDHTDMCYYNLCITMYVWIYNVTAQLWYYKFSHSVQWFSLCDVYQYRPISHSSCSFELICMAVMPLELICKAVTHKYNCKLPQYYIYYYICITLSITVKLWHCKVIHTYIIVNYQCYMCYYMYDFIVSQQSCDTIKSSCNHINVSFAVWICPWKIFLLSLNVLEKSLNFIFAWSRCEIFHKASLCAKKIFFYYVL